MSDKKLNNQISDYDLSTNKEETTQSTDENNSITVDLEAIEDFETLETPIILKQRYQIIKKIGEGGTSNVYEAFDLEDKKELALKIIKKNSKVISAKKRFELEGKTLKNFSKYPNIINIYDYFLCGEYSVIVMELLKGKTLKEILKEKKILSVEQTLNYMFQIINALEIIHGEEIMHRDLKPQNIHINEVDNTIKLMDFGIIQADVDQSITQTNYVVGSVEYMAPEILKGNKATPRSEIYSLGIIMYSMLTGVVPLKGLDFKDTAKKHLHELPPNLTEYNPNVDEEINKIVIKMLNIDDYERQSSMEELRKELKEYQDKTKVKSEEKTVKKSLGKVSDEILLKNINDAESKKIKPFNSKILVLLVINGILILVALSLIFLIK